MSLQEAGLSLLATRVPGRPGGWHYQWPGQVAAFLDRQATALHELPGPRGSSDA